MIRKITELSAKLAAEKAADSEILERRKKAIKGQSPRFLLISPIHRGSQDLQVFRFGQGDAFHATRVPEHPLPLPEHSPFLFGGPAAYNSQFPQKTGVILTFDKEEPGDVVRNSIHNAAEHPDFKDIPIFAFRVDYDNGKARLEAHGYGRNYEIENYILKRISRPDYLDSDTLVILCSDSRISPPVTPDGVPMSIQTLGAYLPSYSESLEESVQLDEFFRDWLSKESDERRIVLVVHGNFEGEGPPCGAAHSSLNSKGVSEDYLRHVIEHIAREAEEYEKSPADSPEKRAITIGKITMRNLRSYPSINEAIKKGVLHDEFMRLLEMDTVTNVVSPYEVEPI